MTKQHGFLGHTIVQGPQETHNPRRVVVVLTLMALTCCNIAVWAQESEPKEKAEVSQLISVGVSGGLTLFFRSLNINQAPAECAPCDRATVPAYDRWAIHDPIGVYSTMSDYLLLGLALGTWIDLAATEGSKAAFSSIETVGWTWAATELSKVLLGRKRPVLYTAGAPDEADKTENLRSMPSGHTSIAFALATSYILNTRDRENKFPAILAGAAAVSIGVLRVAAGRHFPSDVVVGAAIGMGGAAVVYQIRF
jgi:membrane-associated phospholipid phosphatase